MEITELLFVYAMVFVLSAIPFIEALFLTPIAILGGLSFWPVLILAIAGNLLTVYLVIIFIDYIKAWRKKRGKENNKRSSRAKNLWSKYGLPGLALLGPFLVGSHLTAFLSLVFGGTKKRVFYWMTISIAGWSLVLGILAVFGIDWFNFDNPFIEDFFNRNTP
ncbi:small multi-drug export protein [Piscibacillus halophilus]|uniref:Putative small multi-drug export protein n=1 Tax=Piscibacillus halophilus TaxID=571933 RepID=A0A1H9KS44_9BACI|nr:small multi-drug export protein [Piscibacillus halophilus]SER01980.1 Putative small multi-drug export protein [Piscibacillus halophilus]